MQDMLYMPSSNPRRPRRFKAAHPSPWELRDGGWSFPPAPRFLNGPREDPFHDRPGRRAPLKQVSI
jgi:hypothetical protein